MRLQRRSIAPTLQVISAENFKPTSLQSANVVPVEGLHRERTWSKQLRSSYEQLRATDSSSGTATAVLFT